MIEIINLIDFSVLRLRNKTDSTWKQYKLQPIILQCVPEKKWNKSLNENN